MVINIHLLSANYSALLHSKRVRALFAKTDCVKIVCCMVLVMEPMIVTRGHAIGARSNITASCVGNFGIRIIPSNRARNSLWSCYHSFLGSVSNEDSKLNSISCAQAAMLLTHKYLCVHMYWRACECCGFSLFHVKSLFHKLVVILN